MAGGNRIVTDATRAEMRRILAEVKAGKFAREFVSEAAAGHPKMGQWQSQGAAHPIEAVGASLRKLSD
jgi:ketol-acid reductoisomerase